MDGDELGSIRVVPLEQAECPDDGERIELVFSKVECFCTVVKFAAAVEGEARRLHAAPRHKECLGQHEGRGTLPLIPVPARKFAHSQTYTLEFLGVDDGHPRTAIRLEAAHEAVPDGSSWEIEGPVEAQKSEVYFWPRVGGR